MAANPMSQVLRHLRRAALQRPGESLTDGQLLTSFTQRRDENAFAALVQRHAPMVWGVCRRVLGDDHEAEDAFQATFLVLVRKAPSVVPPERVANWLHGVARTTALRARSLNARRRAKERQVSELPEAEARPDEGWNDLRPLLDAELARLPEKYRIPVVLCDLEERTIKEAARHLGWPQGTVAGRLARARAMLAKRLARRGLAVSSGALAVLLAEQAAPACVPALVVSSTIKGVLLFAADRMASDLLSARAAALMEGVVKSMMLTKLKTVTAAVVVTAASLTALGGGLATNFPSAAPQTAEEKHKKPPDQPSKKATSSLADDLNILSERHQAKSAARKDKPEKAKTDLERLQGAWSVVSMEVGGKREDIGKSVFLVDGKRACWQANGDDKAQGGLYLNEASEPKTYDVAMTERTIEGIYSLDGDTLKMCYVIGGEAERPSRFTSKPAKPRKQQALVVLKKIAGGEIFPFWNADGTRGFPNLVEGEDDETPPPPPATSNRPSTGAYVPDETPPPLLEASDAAERGENALPQPRFMPRQALVRLQKDSLVVRTLDVMIEPITVSSQGRQITSYQMVEMLKTRRFPTEIVKVYDVKGKRISPKRLGELLKKETVALISSEERAADPLNLRLFKEGTLLLILPSYVVSPLPTVNAYPAPPAAPPFYGPIPPAPTPVPYRRPETARPVPPPATATPPSTSPIPSYAPTIPGGTGVPPPGTAPVPSVPPPAK